MADVRAHLREGPYDDHWAAGSVPLPEHLRVYRCTGCELIHADDEAEGDYPRQAARYSLSDSTGPHAVYLWDAGKGCDGECLTSRMKHAPNRRARDLEPVAAWPAEVGQQHGAADPQPQGAT